MAVIFKKYSAGYLDKCVTVLGDAFVSNPLHVSAFGRGRLDQNRLFFRIGIKHMFVGQSFVALDNDEVCGYVHFNAWPYCLPAPEEIPNVVANTLTPLGEALPKVIQWFARWCHLDPDEPHVHLGPIGVAPARQGRGIGTGLMHCYINHLEEEKSAGYLETDRPENVEFYERFGFFVRRNEELIGVPIWHMWRPASA